LLLHFGLVLGVGILFIANCVRAERQTSQAIMFARVSNTTQFKNYSSVVLPGGKDIPALLRQ
jgi:hypothetical protein